MNAETGDAPQEITMQPGERVVYRSDQETFSRQKVTTQLYTSWKENRLIFESAPLRTIAQLLEDTYDYQVIISDPSLREVHITATVAADRPDTLLKLLEKLLAAPVRQEGNIIRIGTSV